MAHRLIDLFSGIGGIRLAFEQTGKFQCVMSCEKDAKAARTYQSNFGDDPTGDVTKIAPETLPEFEVLTAGFPCQAFSIAGKGLGFADRTRGTLFFDVARIIQAKRPACVFLENVKGLTHHDGGKTFRIVIATLEELGYHVHHAVLVASNYGVPQKRARIYIVGIRTDMVELPHYSKPFKFPTPTGCETRVKDILDDCAPASKFLSTTYYNGLVKHRQRQEAAGRGFGYEILNMNGYANTLVCGGMGKERNLVVDMLAPFPYPADRNDKYVRMLTPKEWARLQGFPEDFKLPGNDTVAYKQLGNSVAIPVVRAIAEEMALSLDRLWPERKAT